MCPDCGRAKMLFESEAKANNFIKFNGDDIDSGENGLRSYYCKACGGYHITSKPFNEKYNHSTDKLIKAYEKDTILNNAQTVPLPEMSDLARKIIETLPRRVNSKTKLRKYLTEYFADNVTFETPKDERKLRGELYRILKSGTYDIRQHVQNGKVLSDEDIFKLINDKYKVDIKTFRHSLNVFINKNNVLVLKDQRKRLMVMLAEYIKKNKENGNVKEKEISI